MMFSGFTSRWTMPRVGVGQRLQGAANGVQCLVQGQRAATLDHHVVQVAAGHVFEHQVVPLAFLAHVIEGHDVGVGKPGHGARLAQKTGARFLAGDPPCMEELDRHVAAQRLVVGAVDHAHAALADAFDQAVAALQARRRIGIHLRGGLPVHRFFLHDVTCPSEADSCPPQKDR
jgi:hypothetical protein